MKQDMKNIKQNQITINSSNNGHIFNIYVEMNEKPKAPRDSSFWKNIIGIVQRLKKIVIWLKMF